MSKTNSTIWDPRNGDDYVARLEQGNRPVFSSVECNCVVIVLDGKSAINEVSFYPDLIFDILVATGTQGIFNVYPKRSLRHFEGINGIRLDAYGDAWFARFLPSVENTRAILTAMRLNASYEEWLLGSSDTVIDPIDAFLRIENSPSPQLDYFLSRVEKIGSLFCFNYDSDYVTIVFKATPNCDTIIEKIRSTIRSAK